MKATETPSADFAFTSKAELSYTVGRYWPKMTFDPPYVNLGVFLVTNGVNSTLS